MPRIASNLKLLQDPLPRELDALPPLLLRNLLRGQRQLSVFLPRSSLLLLLLDRFALPSARHVAIVVSRPAT